MAVVTLDGTPFGVRSLPRRKARAVEDEGRACRDRAIAAVAKARAVNGDSEVSCLGLGADRVAMYARRARDEALHLWWMAAATAFMAILVSVLLVMAAIECASTGHWAPLLLAVATEALVLSGIVFVCRMLFRRNTEAMADGIAGLAGTQASILSIGDGRLYLTEPGCSGSVREIRYDALGSARHEGGRVALCDRAGRVLVDMGRAPRLDGLPGEAGVAAAVAEIRRRIPDFPAAA